MERNGETRKMTYYAVDADGNPFTHCYGPDEGKTYFSDSIDGLAHYIAYYTHRWRPTLMKTDGKTSTNAAATEQESFVKRLDSEFFFFENK